MSEMVDVTKLTKGDLLKLGRDVPCVLKVPPRARELFYQCLLRCDKEGRIRSFNACARAAGIANNNLARVLNALKEVGLVYTNGRPKGGGGFHLKKLVALYQEVDALHEYDYPQSEGSVTLNLRTFYPQSEGTYKTLKKKKEGASRNFSSWTDRDDDGGKPMVCSTEVI